MIGWATLKRGKVAHGWFAAQPFPGSWVPLKFGRRSACGRWEWRSNIADGEHPQGRRCRACVRALKQDFKRKRGGAIY